jgi:AraC-like DNA-binding protein
VQHIEFFHRDHFENNYKRIPAKKSLSHFIEFFWQTDFGLLWNKYPEGFSDALFPNIGYTYLINLGTPYVMQLEEDCFGMKGDGFLPRHTSIECHHKPGNCLFGIKFRISPEIFEKKINFSEYTRYIFPLSYLLDEKVVLKAKRASSFDERVRIISSHYDAIVERHAGSLQYVHIVRNILDECWRENKFHQPVESFAKQYQVSTRTLQRYFEITTGISGKKALQIMRIRKACAHLAVSPGDFHYSTYGYYDHSHFYKHLKTFLHRKTLYNLKPHLELLKSIHK